MLADHSDRSGSATFLLKEIIAQDLSDRLVATIADAKATMRSWKRPASKPAMSSTWRSAALSTNSAGDPFLIPGTILNAAEGFGQFGSCVKFGRDNVLIFPTYLVQIMEPFALRALGLDLDAFKVFAIKSRVHFRSGFYDNGFAKTILLVEPDRAVPRYRPSRRAAVPECGFEAVLSVWGGGGFGVRAGVRGFHPAQHSPVLKCAPPLTWVASP